MAGPIAQRFFSQRCVRHAHVADMFNCREPCGVNRERRERSFCALLTAPGAFVRQGGRSSSVQGFAFGRFIAAMKFGVLGGASH